MNDEFFSLPLFPQQNCGNGSNNTSAATNSCCRGCGSTSTGYCATSVCSNCGTTCGACNSLCPRCGCTMTLSS